MVKKDKVLFDASAIIALLKKEDGYKELENVLAASCISAVNFSEVVSVLIRASIPHAEAIKIVTETIPCVIPFTQEIGLLAGLLIKAIWLIFRR